MSLAKVEPDAPRGAFRPDYLGVFAAFARNSLVRDMTFRTNFFIDCVSALAWMGINVAFYTLVVFRSTNEIAGWTRPEFFLFLGTTILINSLIETLFMPNAEEFSELIRTGRLDFALVKPIDTQFLISLQKIDWSSLTNVGLSAVLMAYALPRLPHMPSLLQAGLYPLFVVCGALIMYSVMILLASTSVWLGRNQTLYDFWFYITNFARYPKEVFDGFAGLALRMTFTFVLPVLLVVNVPARIIAKPFAEQQWWYALAALVAAGFSLWISRRVFHLALNAYRSASS